MLTAQRIGFEHRSNIPIHRGLISSYTAELAAFVRIGSLDRLFANGEYCFQFCFCGIEKLRLIHCRNYGSRLNS